MNAPVPRQPGPDYYPLLVLGVSRRNRSSHRAEPLCLDCATEPLKAKPLLAKNGDAERATCAECGRHLRAASAFGALTEDDYGLRD